MFKTNKRQKWLFLVNDGRVSSGVCVTERRCLLQPATMFPAAVVPLKLGVFSDPSLHCQWRFCYQTWVFFSDWWPLLQQHLCRWMCVFLVTNGYISNSICSIAHEQLVAIFLAVFVPLNVGVLATNSHLFQQCLCHQTWGFFSDQWPCLQLCVCHAFCLNMILSSP